MSDKILQIKTGRCKIENGVAYEIVGEWKRKPPKRGRPSNASKFMSEMGKSARKVIDEIWNKVYKDKKD